MLSPFLFSYYLHPEYVQVLRRVRVCIASLVTFYDKMVLEKDAAWCAAFRCDIVELDGTVFNVYQMSCLAFNLSDNLSALSGVYRQSDSLTISRLRCGDSMHGFVVDELQFCNAVIHCYKASWSSDNYPIGFTSELFCVKFTSLIT